MFDIGWSELVVIGVVALIAIGPKELPAVLRTVGQYMGKVRRMASEFQGQFQEAMREAEMADIKKSVDEMTESAKGLANFDPLGDVKSEVESFAADPLGASAAASDSSHSPAPASASPESASVEPASATPASSEPASVTPEPAAAPAPESSQPHPETKSGSGA